MSETRSPAYVCLNCNAPCFDIRCGVCCDCGNKVVRSGSYVWNPDIPQKRWRETYPGKVFSVEVWPVDAEEEPR